MDILVIFHIFSTHTNKRARHNNCIFTAHKLLSHTSYQNKETAVLCIGLYVCASSFTDRYIAYQPLYLKHLRGNQHKLLYTLKRDYVGLGKIQEQKRLEEYKKAHAHTHTHTNGNFNRYTSNDSYFVCLVLWHMQLSQSPSAVYDFTGYNSVLYWRTQHSQCAAF